MMSKGKDRKKRVYRKRGELPRAFVVSFLLPLRVAVQTPSIRTVPRNRKRRRRLLLSVQQQQQQQRGARCEVGRSGRGSKLLGCNALQSTRSRAAASFLLLFPPLAMIYTTQPVTFHLLTLCLVARTLPPSCNDRYRSKV